MEELEMGEMTCVCGEVLRAPKEKPWRRWENPEPPEGPRGQLAALYAEHMKREDHKVSGEEWLEAGRRIEAGKESAKKFAKSTEGQ